MSSDYEMDLRDASYDSSLYEEIKETLESKTSQYTISKDEITGIFKGTLEIKLPNLIVSVYKRDKNDVKYALNASIQDVVSEVVAQALED
tara:strand:+ start:246 stop:515 length:270 start_codon:yes stop_codon:yes gene_type:complete